VCRILHVPSFSPGPIIIFIRYMSSEFETLRWKYMDILSLCRLIQKIGVTLTRSRFCRLLIAWQFVLESLVFENKFDMIQRMNSWNGQMNICTKYICRNKCVIIQELKCLFTTANVLNRCFCRCSVDVKLRLFGTFCLCFYDLGLWNYKVGVCKLE